MFLLLGSLIRAQEDRFFPSTEELKKWSLEQLMETDITIVSKNPSPWFKSAASVQVISSEEIRRSGARSIPEILQLTTKFNVAQFNEIRWAVSSRGFNDLAANKLQVLIDGRSIFNEWFAGVSWEALDILLDDIERIEIISGPGGSLWGTNAVNGIINIITKDASQTAREPLYVEAESNFDQFISGAIRYSNRLGTDAAFRIYTKYSHYDITPAAVADTLSLLWNQFQTGLRMDVNLSESDLLNIQGDIYEFKSNKIAGAQVKYQGGNIFAKWNHKISDRSNFSLKSFFDYTQQRGLLGEDLTRGDVEFQHETYLDPSNHFSWGLGFRIASDRSANLPEIGFLPANAKNSQYNAFIQDEISLTNEFKVTLGSKFIKDDYSKFDFQPRVQLAYSLSETDFIWAAVTRSLRKVSRFDRDFFLPTQPPYIIAGGPDFVSEKAISYEAGFRSLLMHDYLFDASFFYNNYDDLRSVEIDLANLPGTVRNGLSGKSYGAEVSITGEINDWWRIKTAYAFLQKFIYNSGVDLYGGAVEGNDSKHRVIIQSLIDITKDIEFDLHFRYSSRLPNIGAEVPAYAALNARLGWQPNDFISLSISVQNVFPKRHIEFSSLVDGSGEEIERQVFGKLTFSL